MEYEYRDRDWEMWLEGSADDKPNELEIIEHAKSKGFELKNIEIRFDNLQKFWRFNADLVRDYVADTAETELCTGNKV